MNSSGSVTPVKNTARPADKNIDLYFFFLSSSTFLYIANAAPINEALERITWPNLNLAGVTVANKLLYAAVSPAPFKLIKSDIHAYHNGSWPDIMLPALAPVITV